MFKGFGFQTKLFLLYFVVITTVIITALFAFYFYNSSIVEKQSIINLNQIANKSSDQIDSVLTEMDRISLYIVTNPTINKVFSNINKPSDISNFYISGTLENQAVMDNLMSIYTPSPASSLRISIFNKYGNYISIGLPDSPNIIKDRLASDSYLSWFNGLMLDVNGRNILLPHNDFWSADKNIKMISLLREIKNIDTNYSYGIVEIQHPFSVLEKFLMKDHLSSYNTLLVDENGNVIYSTFKDNANTFANFYTSTVLGKNSGNMKITNPVTKEIEMLAYKKSSYSSWTLFMVESNENLLAPMRFLAGILVVIGLILWLITMITVFIITNRLTKPIKLLRNSVREVSLNNLSINIDHWDNNNEIIQLNDAFNSMFKRLEESMSELIQIRAHEMKAHMIALQSQMDPHFLYNMLSVISASCRDTKNQKATDMCLMMSDMLRYTTSYNDDLVPIKDEIEHVSNYLKLMKFRFEDRFDYNISVDEKVLENFMDIPKLTLQPLVENCFQHGFKKVPSPWFINITAGYENKLWFVEVSDNGVGFEGDKIEELLKRADQFISSLSTNIKDLKLGGMGLINTLVRLKLIYKSNMLFKVERSENSGSKITIGGYVE